MRRLLWNVVLVVAAAFWCAVFALPIYWTITGGTALDCRPSVEAAPEYGYPPC